MDSIWRTRSWMTAAKRLHKCHQSCDRPVPALNFRSGYKTTEWIGLFFPYLLTTTQALTYHMSDWPCAMRKSGLSSTVALEPMIRSLAVHPGVVARTAHPPDGWFSHLASPTMGSNRSKTVYCIQSCPVCSKCSCTSNILCQVSPFIVLWPIVREHVVLARS